MYYNKRSKGNMTSLLVKYNQACVFDLNWIVHVYKHKMIFQYLRFLQTDMQGTLQYGP